MHKTIKLGGQKIEVRGLTWGEKKGLREEGVDLANLEPGTGGDEAVARVIQTVCGEINLDPLPSSEVYGLFHEIMKRTFVPEDEAKN